MNRISMALVTACVFLICFPFSASQRSSKKSSTASLDSSTLNEFRRDAGIWFFEWIPYNMRKFIQVDKVYFGDILMRLNLYSFLPEEELHKIVRMYADGSNHSPLWQQQFQALNHEEQYKNIKILINAWLAQLELLVKTAQDRTDMATTFIALKPYITNFMLTDSQKEKFAGSIKELISTLKSSQFQQNHSISDVEINKVLSLIEEWQHATYSASMLPQISTQEMSLQGPSHVR